MSEIRGWTSSRSEKGRIVAYETVIGDHRVEDEAAAHVRARVCDVPAPDEE
jgi:hypothetical protein